MTEGLSDRLAHLQHATFRTLDVPAGEDPQRLTTHLAGVIKHALEAEGNVAKRVELAQKIIDFIGDDYRSESPDAQEGLSTLAEIRRLDDPTHKALHAKAWMFHRESGFSTAYVGSSNLSKSALLDGLEWNVRLSAIATPELMRKFEATFETYWQDPSFEPYNPDKDATHLDREIKNGSFSSEGKPVDLTGLDVRPYPYQALMLEDLQVEQAIHHRHRNLIIAAIGTGKTVIAGLDYRNLVTEYRTDLRLLFVAHRKEILEQALRTYRNILAGGSFRELFVDGLRPQD